MKRRKKGQGCMPDVSTSPLVMSEMLWELAGPFISEGKTPAQRQNRLLAACTAWNAACSSPDKRNKLLELYIATDRLHHPERTDEELAAIRREMDELIRRKRRLFPSANKRIVNAQMTRTPEGDRIDVASLTVKSETS